MLYSIILLKFNRNTEKKPPHHLQPIDNLDDHEDQNISKQISISEDIYHGLDSSRQISIPINYRDKDHINLDINLKLSEFMPNNNANHQSTNSNRYYDDFEINSDPLSKHIRRFEGISRSLPGSSGSLNKSKPLPPVSKRNNFYDAKHDHESAENRTEGLFGLTL